MSSNEEILHNISEQYFVQVMRAFGNIDPCSKALGIIGKALNEIYRYFEPEFFKGEFYICKNFSDTPCFDEGVLLYDKSILLNRTGGLMIIQVFDDSNKLILWETKNPADIINKDDTLVYYFHNNREYFYAKSSKIDITIYNSGSRFATQFNDLIVALQQYSTHKIFQSSCKHFIQSWADDNRLFFKGGGSGSNIPEKFMQTSLYEFLNTILGRGINIEPAREHNVIGNADNAKPVDVKVHWREANRTALIEVKFIGTVKKDSDGEIYNYLEAKANRGIEQLKGYYDKAKSDTPNTIIKAYIIVIDGRRNNLTKDTFTINAIDGLFYKDIDIVIDEDKKFHMSIQGFEKPIRMFASPICV